MPLIMLIVLSVVLLLLLGIIGGTIYFFRVAFLRQEKTFLAQDPDLEQIVSEELPIVDVPWVDRQNFEIVEMKSIDGLLLRGYYLPAPQPTTKTVILAHGYAGKAKDNMGGFAHLYHEQLGFNIFMPDARGHGISEGRYICFGWPERKDYVKWIATMMQKVGSDVQIVLHGISMGASTVLMTSGERLPEQVKCIVSDCAYTSVRDILAFRLQRMYKLPAFPFVHLTSLLCKLRLGFFFGEASALEQVKKAQKPIFFIHGTEDDFVPTSMVYPLYEHCPTEKELYLAPNARHGVAYIEQTATYTQKLRQFLDRYIV